MNQIEQLKLLLGITDSNKDIILEFVISRVEDSIKNYCNLEYVPAELNNIVLSMAMEIYRIENFGSEETGKTVKTIAVGDTTTTFETNINKEVVQGLLKDYKLQIDPFRRVRW